MTRAAHLVLAATALVAPATAAASVFTHLGEVRACRPLPGGDVLVGTGGGLARLGPAGEVRAVWTAVDGLPGTRIDAIASLGDELWIGTERGAALIELAGTRLTVQQRASERAVRAVVRHAGARYLATWDGGVVRLAADGSLTAIPMRGGGSKTTRARVAALVVAGGTLYAGTAGGLFALRRGQLEAVPLLTTAPGPLEITGLATHADTLWIATTSGLLARTGDVVTEHGGGDVRAVTVLDGQIVVAQLGGGLARADRGRLVPLADGPTALVLAQAVAGGEGAACAGGLDGLHVRAAGQARWVVATPPVGLPANDVSALAVDGARLWVGMFDHGVAVRERGAWRAITSPQLDHRVNALLVEPRPGGARVWVATATGVSIIEGERVTQLGKRDGLPARGVLSLARMADGRILAGTMQGAVILGAGRPQPLGAKQQIAVTNVWAVAEDAAGWLWLGTTTGLYRGRPGDEGWTRYAVATGHLRDDWVMAIAVKGATLWVGTYKGGVTRFEPAAPGSDAVRATPLGDGWINPGGLAWHGDELRAATMEGLRTGDGASAVWTATTGLPGTDTTATAVIGDTLWIATRRGLVARPR